MYRCCASFEHHISIQSLIFSNNFLCVKDILPNDDLYINPGLPTDGVLLFCISISFTVGIFPLLALHNPLDNMSTLSGLYLYVSLISMNISLCPSSTTYPIISPERFTLAFTITLSHLPLSIKISQFYQNIKSIPLSKYMTYLCAPYFACGREDNPSALPPSCP